MKNNKHSLKTLNKLTKYNKNKEQYLKNSYHYKKY